MSIIETSASVPPPEETLPARLTPGFTVDDQAWNGFGDLLAPLYQPGNGLLFLAPRASRNDNGDEQYDLGLGYRWLLPGRNVILGANVFYDTIETDEADHDQVGWGIEMLGDRIDARANYYDADNERSVAQRYNHVSTSRSSRSTRRSFDPYAEGHEILQKVETRTVTRTTTTRQFFERYAEAMDGWDAEAGVVVPLPVDRARCELKLFGGWYAFDNPFGGDDIEGFKARAELRGFDHLYLDAAWYDDDELTGSDYYLGARYSAPFDLFELAHGRNPFAEPKAGKNEVVFAARLNEMVMRDPQVRTATSGIIERNDLREVSTHTTTKKSTKRHVLLSDVNFASNSVARAVTVNDGTAEQPYDSIQAAVDNAFGARNVYVFNSDHPYMENVVLSEGITLWGSGCLVPGSDGKSFGSGIMPIIDGHSMGPSVTLANHTTVQGFHIQNTEMGGSSTPAAIPLLILSDVDFDLQPFRQMITTFQGDTRRVGILGYDVSGIALACNHIADNAYGVALFSSSGDFTASISDSTFERNDTIPLSVLGEGHFGEKFDLSVERCVFDDNQGTSVGYLLPADIAVSTLPELLDSVDLYSSVSVRLRDIQQGNTRPTPGPLNSLTGGGIGLGLGLLAWNEVEVELSNVSLSRNQGPGAVILGASFLDYGSIQFNATDVSCLYNGMGLAEDGHLGQEGGFLAAFVQGIGFDSDRLLGDESDDSGGLLGGLDGVEVVGSESQLRDWIDAGRNSDLFGSGYKGTIDISLSNVASSGDPSTDSAQAPLGSFGIALLGVATGPGAETSIRLNNVSANFNGQVGIAVGAAAGNAVFDDGGLPGQAIISLDHVSVNQPGGGYPIAIGAFADDQGGAAAVTLRDVNVESVAGKSALYALSSGGAVDVQAQGTSFHGSEFFVELTGLDAEEYRPATLINVDFQDVSVSGLDIDVDRALSGQLRLENCWLDADQDGWGLELANGHYEGPLGQQTRVEVPLQTDLGGGSLGSIGGNYIAGLRYDGMTFISAENNWWGQSPPNPAKIVLMNPGAIDITPWRTASPLP